MRNIDLSIRPHKVVGFSADSEHVQSGKKRPSRRSTLMMGAARFIARGITYSLILSLSFSRSYALPVGGTVVSGSASIASSGTKVTVTETSQNAVINWQSFSISPGQSVQFIQPNGTATVLNRVQGADASTILGGLSANGQVFLVNPNGIQFGKTAQVNVGGLVASTLGISNDDFMAGRYNFSGSSGALVANQGSIKADGGYVALLGATIDNSGVISAKLGSVALAAGTAITIDLAGDGLLSVTVNQGAVNALVRNGGMIQADGGQVLLTAKSAGALLTSVVNNTGVIEAESIQNHNGTISLLGDPQSGIVTASGTLDVSGPGAGQTGGTVQVLGQTVALAGGSINASGDAGGGLVLVGGNFHGAGPQTNSQTTTIDKGSVINANAVNSGDGGRIAVWSDGDTSVAGTLTANGGANSGNGGYIETSGHNLTYTGVSVSAAAPKGADGTWLLDPFDLQIDAAAANTIAAVLGGSTNVTLQTFATAAPSGTGNVVIGPGDITILALGAITWSTTATLTLNAFNTVTVGEAITTTGGKLVLIAGTDVTVNAAMTATSGTISATAGNNVNVNAAVVTTDGGFTAIAGKNVDITSAITTTRGPLVLVAGDNGSGVGTVIDTGPPGAVTGAGASVDIYYNPTSYGSPTDYSSNFTLTNALLHSYMDVSFRGSTKVYDGTTPATLTLFGSPDPAKVTITAGTATYDTKDVGTGKAITYSGYTMAGVTDVYNGKSITHTAPASTVLVGASDYTGYALVTGSGQTTGNITPAPLTVTANSTSKVYGSTVSFAGTEFTSSGLVHSETIGTVGLTSPGAAPTAAVAGSPYAITPAGATGGSFLAADYTITYVNGALTITPQPLVITANSTSKVFGTALSFAGTEFTSSGLENGQTIGSVGLASSGTPAAADVGSSPYAITATNAVGGTFVASNYGITYVNGALTVTPVGVTPPAPPVVTPGQTTDTTPGSDTFPIPINSATAETSTAYDTASADYAMVYNGTGQPAVLPVATDTSPMTSGLDFTVVDFRPLPMRLVAEMPQHPAPPVVIEPVVYASPVFAPKPYRN